MRKALCLPLLLCCLLMHGLAFGQAWQWASGCTGGSEGLGIATDAWGNSYGSGFSNPAYGSLHFGSTTLTSLGSSAAVVVKYDANGKLLWANSTHNGFARPLGIASDNAGYLYLLSYYTSFTVELGPIVLNKPVVDTELFLAKFAPDGQVLWAKNLCSGNITGSIVLSNTGVYITSSYKSPTLALGPSTLTNADPSGSSFDFFVARLDTAGNVLWARGNGGTGDEYGINLAVTKSGNIYLSGNFSSPSLVFGGTVLLNSSVSLFVARYDSLGNLLWAFKPEGDNKFGAGLATDDEEHLFITGTFYRTSMTFGGITVNPEDTFSDAFVALYDSAANAIWAKKIWGNFNIFGYSAVTDICGNFWICGNMPRGDTSFVVVDSNVLRPASDEKDPLFVAHWAATGVYLGGSTLPTAGDDIANIGTDGVGNIFIAGDYWGGPFTIAHDKLEDPRHDYEDIFIAKYAPYTGLDTTREYHLVCISDSAVLQVPPGYSVWQWDNGSTAATRTVSTPGTYKLICTGLCGSGVLSDVFRVDYGRLDTTYMHTDTSICLHARTVLVAPAGYEPYYWSDGDTTQVDTIGNAGTYLAICAGNCTIPTLYDTFHVVYNQTDLGFSLGDDTDLCAPYPMDVPLNGVSCVWQDGSVGNDYTADAPGTYYVFVSTGGCFNSDTVNLYYPNLSQNLTDTIVCRDHPVMITLKANAPQGAGVLWSTGSKEHEINVSAAGTYWVSVNLAACSAADTMTLAETYCYCTAFLPDAFTPNGDGLNDYFFPIIDKGCNVYDYSFCIYNRWGQLIFTTHDPGMKWDGKFHETMQDMGTYMYYLDYRAGNSMYRHLYKGDVILVR